MPFAPGTRLGPFEIIGPLELAGIGEAYRARDHEQQRSVALRVVRADFGGNPALLQRFEQEARAAAQLSHPNILVLHDVGTDAQAAYVVSEPIEGRSLRDLVRGGPLPVRTALQYAAQIVEALAAAHERGAIHRDLKPENVVVGPDGRVRVLGFGLAAVTQSESGLAGLKGSAPGTTLGTPSYMSPEQVRGVPADIRSDMFAFGAIAYEMLTGDRAFGGDTPLATMTAVAKSEPARPLSQMELPPMLARMVELCLSKNAAKRPAADDVARVLHSLGQPPVPAAPVPAAPAPTPPVPAAPVPPAAAPPRAVAPAPAPAEAPAIDQPSDEELFDEEFDEEPPRARRLVPLLVAAGVLILIVALAPAALRVLRSTRSGTVAPPASDAGAAIAMPDRPVGEFALSPDGQRLAFTAAEGTGPRVLWVKSLTPPGEQPLAGTEGAAFPFWSPDSRFIAYVAQGKLRKVPAAGGMPAVVADAAGAPAGAWSRDDVIVFPRDAAGGPLYRVAAGGGTPEAATALGRGEAAHRWPVFLDGRRFLYTVVPAGAGEPSVQLGSLDSMAPEPVLANASQAALVEGYVLFVRDHALTAQSFDPERLATRGDPVGVGGAPAAGGAAVRAFSVSSAGVLALQAGQAPGAGGSRLVWVDRAGAEVGTVGDPDAYGDVTLSPKGERIAVSVRGASARDIVIVDAATGMRTPLTSDPGDDYAPVWSADGRQVAFASTRSGTTDIYQKAATGAGNEVALVQGPGDQIPYTSDGQYLLYQTNQRDVAAGGNFDLWARALQGGRSFAYLRTIRAATRPQIAPNRRQVAYTSFEDGREDVYVASFPRYSGRTRVSARGGSWPRWGRDGADLFFIDAANRLMAAPVANGRVGDARALFPLRAQADAGYPYDVAPDGRILVTAAGEGSALRPLTLVDWRARVRP
ncbi:MAG: serine/threonine-protein kinase [Acidobacteria bacterium]|nr:serine/threonine-protein kinase [Acidobacteriota bacterium]